MIFRRKNILFPLVFIVLVSTVSTESFGQSTSIRSILGTWDIKIEIQDQSIDMGFTISFKGDSLSGTFASPMGNIPLHNIKVTGKTISFQVIFENGPSPFEMTLTGRVTGENIEGTLRSQAGSRSFKGSRKKKGG